jgi:hypothetical protein
MIKYVKSAFEMLKGVKETYNYYFSLFTPFLIQNAHIVGVNKKRGFPPFLFAFYSSSSII